MLLDTPQAKYIAALAAVAVLLLTYGLGRHDGARMMEAEWQKEKAELNAAAVDKLQAKIVENAEKEAQHAQKIRNITDSFNSRLTEIKNEKTSALTVARGRGLYVNTRCPSDRNPLPEASSGVAADYRIARTRLSDEDADFLITLAADADKVVEQLTACQAVLQQDRE